MSENSFKERMMRQRAENVEKVVDQIRIEDVARELGLDLARHGRLLHVVGHESCIIYSETNSYYRWSTGKGGSIFNFVQEFNDMSFNEAYKFLVAKIDPTIELTAKEKTKQRRDTRTLQYKQERTIKLNEQLSSATGEIGKMKTVLAYLIKERGINKDLVYEMINKNLLKQQIDDYGNHTAVFLGYDDVGMLAAACKRNCSFANKVSNFKGDFSSCDYNFGWLYEPTLDNSSFFPKHDMEKPIVCFESYIDLMSYVSIQKELGLDPTRFNYLSIGSAAKWKTVLSNQEQYKFNDVILAFDNDKSGFEASLKCKKELEERGCKVRKHVSIDKDWNQDLKKKLQVNKYKALENTKKDRVNRELTR